MPKIRSGVMYSSVSTNTVISTKPCLYYGCSVVNRTTAGVQALIYDATATGLGNLVDVVTVAAGTYANAKSPFVEGVAMRTGIYLSALVATTASDSIIVFYGGL